MGDALQYLLGAGILGVLLTQLFAAWRDHRERERERNGLLRIVHSEITLNQGLLKVVDVLYHARTQSEERRMMAGWGTLGRERVYQEAWEATRVQLAQHLPSKEFGIIAGYYSNLMKLKEAVSKSQEPRRPFGHRDNSPEFPPMWASYVWSTRSYRGGAMRTYTGP
jgi:hypothetical protein